MALYILWYHASVLVCCCCCCFIQLGFLQQQPPPRVAGAEPGARPPARPESWPGAGGRGPHERERATVGGGVPLAQEPPFPFLPLIGVKLSFPFSSFIGVKPPFLFWVKLHIVAFYFIYTKHEIDQVKCSIYIYIYLCGKTPPTDGEPPFLFFLVKLHIHFFLFYFIYQI